MKWSPQQDLARRDVSKWLRDPGGQQVFRLFGYAGTGKTTLAKSLTDQVKGLVLYGAFTGKAALQLRRKGCVNAQTLHSMIYEASSDDEGNVEFVLNERCDLANATLLVVDEVSMVGQELADDLMSFGVPILVLGDPAQLPPVNGDGYFINAVPDVMLTEVHRQALDNPIVRLAMDVREGRPLQCGAYGESLVIKRRDIGQDALRELVIGADQVLCGLNKTRAAFNSRIRHLKGLVGQKESFHPAPRDRLICLRNDKRKKLFNGSLWGVYGVDDKMGRLDLALSSQDEADHFAVVTVADEFFCGKENTLGQWERKKYQEFAFGWAITVHKSQGSEFPNVVLFDESASFREASAKFLYTGITRASEKVTVIQ